MFHSFEAENAHAVFDVPDKVYFDVSTFTSEFGTVRAACGMPSDGSSLARAILQSCPRARLIEDTHPYAKHTMRQALNGLLAIFS